ncbi:hypothetical protein DFH01_10630 [Falsiroseomonas bella]|uniref:Uncharacterized protein n=1 Tax=Falsiroseomonas bella TaxID=2184016 RepID=A0A317FI33_9PROT|nr:hypothetical protein [Falsiroseomonas bella]PWS37298.1 hypothetical protein DFH01_10630 [Falsiroseomonas bella]
MPFLRRLLLLAATGAMALGVAAPAMADGRKGRDARPAHGYWVDPAPRWVPGPPARRWRGPPPAYGWYAPPPRAYYPPPRVYYPPPRYYYPPPPPPPGVGLYFRF